MKHQDPCRIAIVTLTFSGILLCFVLIYTSMEVTPSYLSTVIKLFLADFIHGIMCCNLPIDGIYITRVFI